MVKEGATALKLVRNLRLRNSGSVGVDFLGFWTDDANQILGSQELAERGNRISFVTLGVGVSQIQLPSEDTSRVIDRFLRHLRSL
jgi:hypothetical protein